jgi:hypothetical protein
MFHIIDEDNEIIDSSDNSLALKQTCFDMNNRIGGECQVVSQTELNKLLEEQNNNEV